MRQSPHRTESGSLSWLVYVGSGELVRGTQERRLSSGLRLTGARGKECKKMHTHTHTHMQFFNMS